MNFDYNLIVQYLPYIRVFLIFIIGFPLILWVSRYIEAKLSKFLTRHFTILVSQAIFYLGIALLAITILKDLGFELSAFLGTAGIVGITLGFAAQTTISNIISGIFLLVEDTFEVGDFVSVTTSNLTGSVESINLFAVKLRTAEGKIVRIPNEYLIKNPITIARQK